MSVLKNTITKHVVRILTHPATRQLRRAATGGLRRLRGAPAQVHYFHQADDPYSHLCVQVLEQLGRRYDVDLLAHLVHAPEDSAAPGALKPPPRWRAGTIEKSKSRAE